MRCLVTGATGHLGSHLVPLLLAGGCQVGVLMRAGSDPWRIRDVLPELQVISGDLADIGASAWAIQRFRPETVLHLGWLGVERAHRDDPAQVTSNLTGSLELFRVAAAAGCQRWVGLGSQAEYGLRADASATTEDAATRPATVYGIAKLCAGLLTQRLAEVQGIRFVWLRLFAAYGPGEAPSHLIPYVINSLLRGQRPSLTPGEQTWDYLYVQDGAQAIWETARSKNARGIFNLGSGQAHRVRDVAGRIRDIIDPSLDIGLGDVPYPPGQPLHLQADVSRVSAATGWAPQIDLDEGLRRTVNWYRSRLEAEPPK